MAGTQRTQLVLRVARTFDGSAIDLDDAHAFFDILALRSTEIRDCGNDCTAGTGVSILTGQIARELADLDTEPAGALLARRRIRMRLHSRNVGFNELDVECVSLAVAYDRQCDVFARLVLRDQPLKLTNSLDLLSIDRDDDIATLDARDVRG